MKKIRILSLDGDGIRGILPGIVLTATKFETNTKNVGKIVYKITQETIKNSAGKTVLDLLNDVPGVEINGNFSTKGQNLGYYIRGGRIRCANSPDFEGPKKRTNN